MNRPHTAKELKWWKQLNAIIRRMPTTMEVQVSAHGTLQAGPRGAVLAALNAGGDAGNADYICLPSIGKSNFVDASGGL